MVVKDSAPKVVATPATTFSFKIYPIALRSNFCEHQMRFAAIHLFKIAKA